MSLLLYVYQVISCANLNLSINVLCLLHKKTPQSIKENFLLIIIIAQLFSNKCKTTNFLQNMNVGVVFVPHSCVM